MMKTITLIVLVVQILAYGEPIDDRKKFDEGYLSLSDCLYQASNIRKSWEVIEHAEIIYIGCHNRS